jgi:hypothetical protein
MEAIAQHVVAVLGAGDFDIYGEFRVRGEGRFSVGVEGLVEAGGEEAGFEAGGAEDGLLGEGDAFEGEEFLGVDGPVDGDEIVSEMGDFLEVFEGPRGHPDGEAGSGEAVFAGILGGAVLAFRGAGACGPGCVGAIGGELFRGNGIRHGIITLRFKDGMRGGLTLKFGGGW